MMKKIFPVICLSVLAMLLPVFSTACSQDSTYNLNKEFTLPAGKTAVISGESLKIKFVEVTADSRCAKGVECVWAGQADCLMLITKGDSQSSITFTQEGSNEVNSMDFNVYNIKFKLEPYPETGKEIKPADYRLVMTVTKFQEKP